MYLIKRTDQGGGYVALPGSKHAYTKNLRLARTFKTRNDALEECCPWNEVPVSLRSLVPTPEGR